MKQKSDFWKRDTTRSVLASLISIVIGMVVGGIVILIVGMTNKSLTIDSALEGSRLVIGGIFCTGRDAAGSLTGE